jgi:glycosyltransferase involved in cell wall biosynthesis
MSVFSGRTSESGSSNGTRRGVTALLVAADLGAGTVREQIMLIADELRAHGIDVVIAALCRGCNADLNNLRCEIMINRERLAASDYFRAFIRLAACMRASDPTAILSFLPMTNILAALSGLLAGVPIRVATHHQARVSHHGFLRGFDRLLGRIGAYSHIVAMSDTIHGSLQGYPRSYLKRVHVIRNTIRPIAPRSDRLAVRRHFGLRSDAVLMVVIGHLAEQENLFNTLAGASRVAGIQLALVGDGPLRSEVERLVVERHLDGKVFLLGHTERQVAADVLFAADVFVQLGFVDAPRPALLEAIYAEKAIVASDIPSQRESLTMRDGRVAGLLCDPCDVGAITFALSAVATNEQLRRDLVSRAAALKQDLDSMRMGREYALLLSEPPAAPWKTAAT